MTVDATPEPPVAREPRRDGTSADVKTLARLGRAEPQPVPAPSVQPFQEPVYDPPLEPLPDDTA